MSKIAQFDISIFFCYNSYMKQNETTNLKNFLFGIKNPEINETKSNNILDSFMGKNYKTFFWNSKNKPVLVDLIRQIFQNREKENISIEEIKTCLEQGKFIDTSTVFYFQETDDWETHILNAISTLKEIGYGIYGDYTYEKDASRFNDIKQYNDICYSSKIINEINIAIEKETNLELVCASSEWLEKEKFISKFIQLCLDTQTRCWSKEQFDRIDFSESFPYITDEALYALQAEMKELFSFKIKESHFAVLMKIYEKYIELDIAESLDRIVLTPYKIIEGYLIGARHTETVKANALYCIPVENVVTVLIHPKRFKLDAQNIIYSVSFEKTIDRQLLEYYGNGIKKFNKDEKLQKIFEDRLWEYVRYHLTYVGDENNSILTEAGKLFSSVYIRNIPSIKQQGVVLYHNNYEDVFNFANKFGMYLIKFTDKNVDNEFRKWQNEQKKKD